jgi:alpha-D-ribose 1-methylphosphonate 5-phosphate C-P lyase
MNATQLYSLYLSIPLSRPGRLTRIYPKYVVITGRSIMAPSPHRYFSFSEFVDKLETDPEFRDFLLKVE